MTKTDFVKVLAQKTGLTVADAAQMYEVFVDTVVQGLLDDGKILVQGLGTFSLKDCPEHAGRNPKTGETVTVAACRKVKFKVASGLQGSL